jgi:hypothetical protein
MAIGVYEAGAEAEAEWEYRWSVDMERRCGPALAGRYLAAAAEEEEAHRSIIVLRAMGEDAQSLCFCSRLLADTLCRRT